MSETSQAAAHDEHAPNVKAYMMVFGALAVLTVVTVAVSYLHLSIVPAVIVAMVIAAFKAGLVASIFMHLKGEKALIYGLLGITVFCLLFLYTLPLADFMMNTDRATHTPVVVEESHVP